MLEAGERQSEHRFDKCMLMPCAVSCWLRETCGSCKAARFLRSKDLRRSAIPICVTRAHRYRPRLSSPTHQAFAAPANLPRDRHDGPAEMNDRRGDQGASVPRARTSDAWSFVAILILGPSSQESGPRAISRHSNAAWPYYPHIQYNCSGLTASRLQNDPRLRER